MSDCIEIPARDAFPPAPFTAGHSANLGGRPDTPDEYLRRIHSLILAVARDGEHYLVIQDPRNGLASFLRQKGYRAEFVDVRVFPRPLLKVTWEPRR